MEGSTKTNGSALFGMFSAVLPTISLICLLALQFILMPFVPARSLGPLLEVLAILLGPFMLASYPLAFILGVIGLRQTSKSEGREKGKGLAWIAIALSSGFCLLLCVLLPICALISELVFDQYL